MEQKRKKLNWNEYFMNIVFETAKRSTCLSEPKGAIIVKSGYIVATGYNGAPSKTVDCAFDRGYCIKRSMGYKSGEGHEFCVAVHAELNAILMCAKNGISVNGATMFCTHKPCQNCMRAIINAGITSVHYVYEYDSNGITEALSKETGVRLIKEERKE